MTPKQLRALDLYMMGKRDEEVAREVGVSRHTANTWRHHDQRFVDALRCHQNEMTRVMRDQQRALAWRVMEVVSHALDEGDTRVALEVGKSLGLFVPVKLPEGPETIQGLEADRAIRQQVARAMADDKAKSRERLAHQQARQEAEHAYSQQLAEAMIPMDEDVYRRRCAELLAEESSKQ